MRVEEKCSCSAEIVIVDEVRQFGMPRDSLYDLQKRIDKRVEEWRKNHNHDMPRAGAKITNHNDAKPFNSLEMGILEQIYGDTTSVRQLFARMNDAGFMLCRKY